MASAPGKLHFFVFNVDLIAFFDVSVVDKLNTSKSNAFQSPVFGTRSVQLARGLTVMEAVWPLFSLRMHCCVCRRFRRTSGKNAFND